LKIKFLVLGLLPFAACVSAGYPRPDPRVLAAVSPELADGLDLQLPRPGQIALRVLSPSLLEITRINTKEPDPARVDSWDFVDAAGVLHLPDPGQVLVTVNETPVAVTAVGFKRRPR
jgi:hypothetical protein